MRIVLLYGFILVLILSCNERNTENSLKVNENILKQANAMGQLFLNDDFNGIIECMYPKLVKEYGKDSILKGLKAEVIRRKEQEMIIDSIRFFNPKRTIDTGNELQTTISAVFYGSNSKVKYVHHTTAIAISGDKGITWHFIISSDNDLKSAQKKFPDLSEKLVIPEDKLIMENTPQSNFQVFWDGFKVSYPVFQINNINWDSVYAVNSRKITSDMTQTALFDIFKSCILTLKDAHSDIVSTQFGSCNYYGSVLNRYPSNFLEREAITKKYVPLLGQTMANENMFYGYINQKNIGYIFIGSFGGNKSDYSFIDDCIIKFKDTKGIIIDIRQNSGGNEGYGRIIASRFTNQPVIYRYKRNKNGSKYSDLSDYIPLVLDPDGKIKYTKNIVLLTSKRTFSSAEDFTLMLRSLPNVLHIGETTFGGVGTNPQYKTLPNGWQYRISIDMNCDNNKKPIKNGIVPQIQIQTSKEDLNKDIDIVLEEAIIRINQKTIATTI